MSEELPARYYRRLLALARAKLQDNADRNPPPDLDGVAEEEIERFLEPLRSIAVWKREGYTNEEIATMLGCTCRTVERKLKLIRTIWAEENPQ